MRVLITGGAGFIGSHVAESLLARGDEVLVIDNFATGRRDNLTPQPRLSLVEGTIADDRLIDRCYRELRPEVVVHAAASYKDPDDWAEDARTNVLGTALVAKAARAIGTRRVIYFQTAMCYGLHPREQPITLAHPIRCDESSYAISKTAGEQLLLLPGLDAISFRMANAYGPRHLTGPFPLFFQRLQRGQPCFVMNTRRDFVYIDDLLALVIKAVDGVGAAGCYHMSSGQDCSIEELFHAVVAAMGLAPRAVEVRERGPDDVFSILLDPSVTERTFDWQAATPLAVGVLRTIADYRTHGVTESYTHLKLDAAADA